MAHLRGQLLAAAPSQADAAESAAAQKLGVGALRERLQQRGLDDSGLKPALLQRLLGSIRNAPAPPLWPRSPPDRGALSQPAPTPPNMLMAGVFPAHYYWFKDDDARKTHWAVPPPPPLPAQSQSGRPTGYGLVGFGAAAAAAPSSSLAARGIRPAAAPIDNGATPVDDDDELLLQPAQLPPSFGHVAAPAAAAPAAAGFGAAPGLSTDPQQALMQMLEQLREERQAAKADRAHWQANVQQQQQQQLQQQQRLMQQGRSGKDAIGLDAQSSGSGSDSDGGDDGGGGGGGGGRKSRKSLSVASLGGGAGSAAASAAAASSDVVTSGIDWLMPSGADKGATISDLWTAQGGETHPPVVALHAVLKDVAPEEVRLPFGWMASQPVRERFLEATLTGLRRRIEADVADAAAQLSKEDLRKVRRQPTLIERVAMLHAIASDCTPLRAQGGAAAGAAGGGAQGASGAQQGMQGTQGMHAGVLRALHGAQPIPDHLAHVHDKAPLPPNLPDQITRSQPVNAWAQQAGAADASARAPHEVVRFNMADQSSRLPALGVLPSPALQTALEHDRTCRKRRLAAVVSGTVGEGQGSRTKKHEEAVLTCRFTKLTQLGELAKPTLRTGPLGISGVAYDVDERVLLSMTVRAAKAAHPEVGWQHLEDAIAMLDQLFVDNSGVNRSRLQTIVTFIFLQAERGADELRSGQRAGSFDLIADGDVFVETVRRKVQDLRDQVAQWKADRQHEQGATPAAAPSPAGSAPPRGSLAIAIGLQGSAGLTEQQTQTVWQDWRSAFPGKCLYFACTRCAPAKGTCALAANGGHDDPPAKTAVDAWKAAIKAKL